MRKPITLFVASLVMLLMLTSIVSSDGPSLGAFTTTGYTLGYQPNPLPDGRTKFYLVAQGGDSPENEARCAEYAALYGLPDVPCDVLCGVLYGSYIPTTEPPSCDDVCLAFTGLPCGVAGEDGFQAAFAFEEWGTADAALDGRNRGSLTIMAADTGTASIKFHGEAAGGFVQGEYRILNGTGAFERLKGQGSYFGTANPVFTVQYEPD